MRAWLATFTGAFLTSLIYTTKPDSDSGVTLARQGDTAIVIDTGRGGDSIPPMRSIGPLDTEADSAVTTPTPVPETDPSIGGSAAPPVVPADLDALRAQNMVIPVAGVAAKDLIDSFDDKRGATRHHNALDIMAARNTPAVAATSGTILKLHESVPGGLTLYMSDRTSRFVLMYGHLDSFRPGLREGMSVRRGEIVGFVGSTGNASPLAPHLHFQITRNDNMKEWWKGTPLNPFLLYRPTG